MPALQFAAQLYTVRAHTQTATDLAKTLRKIRDIGYPAVQLSAIGKIAPAEVATMLRDYGLACCATHTSLDRLRNDTAAVIAEHDLWNCQYTALGAFVPKDPTPKIWQAFAHDFNTIAAQFANSGIAVGYHNHSHELIRLDGRTPLQILLDQLDPKIWFEIDTYWIAHGGADPAAWIDKVAGRIPCVHLKDMSIRPDLKQYMIEVSEGNLNWPAILNACHRAGVQWYIVEQDECDRDPFESLTISLDNLRAMTQSG